MLLGISGKNRGLQAKIKETNPQAVYIHCLAHKLNLIITDTCSSLPFAATFFNTLEALHNHFSQPGNHANLAKVRELLGINSGAREMSSLSKTRWSCRYENCNAVINNFAAIRQTLEEEIEHPQGKNSVEAVGILTTIMKPEFTVQLVVMRHVLSTTNVLSRYFQSKDATLGKARSLIIGILTSFDTDQKKF